MRTLAKVLAAAISLTGGRAWGQAVPPNMQDRLSSVSRASDQIDPMPWLEELCEGIGPRLTGSLAARKAESRALEHMREIGLEQVHSESWMLPRAWKRGSAKASLVAPFAMPIPIAAYGWSGSTPRHSGPVPVVLVDANEVARHLDALVMSQRRNWRGKALLLSLNPDEPERAFSQLLPFVQAATAAGAVAVLRHDARPGNGIVHSEPLTALLPKTIDTSLIPAVDLTVEHDKLMEHLLQLDHPVSMEIDVANSFSEEPVPSNNIIGEIKGAKYPEEVVLVGAHLDSWDLGTGAADDGFGAAAVLGAAQALVSVGIYPERTIRFVLFTGEEEGLLGSRAYVRQHAAEINKIVAAFALDWGAGPIVQLPTAGHPELLPLLTYFNEMTGPLKLQPPTDGWLFMTDAYAFTLVGLPGIAPLIQSSGYFEQAHSAQDTLDKISPADLRQATKVLAMASFFLADTENIPQTHFTPGQTTDALIRGKQEPMLKVFGLWPLEH